MSISFPDLFKRARARLFPVSTGSSSPRTVAVPVAKPSSERLSKTVLPNMTRKVAASGPLHVAPGAASAAAPRVVGFDSTSTSPRSHELPAAVALALEPKAERAISLPLSDILDQLPSDYIKPRETFDSSRTILLKASDVEKGMASGRPTVSLAGIYGQAPEIFLNSVSPTDSTVVPLPFDKVLALFMSLQIRSDQVRDHAVPQVETPFLQVTREDTERFRTSTSATPPKIPFHLPPNGTGAPASERVPALSGPPVPTALPEAQAPAQIPFKVTAPCNDIRPKFIRVPAMEPEPRTGLPTKSAPAKESDAKIALALTAVLKEVPAFQLNGNPSAVPEDVRVEFPLSLIEPQLASGRVVVSPKVLQNAMPEIYRALLTVDPVGTPVSLPLQEILKNLPVTVLRMRDDQEEIVLKQTIETPFSIKADEDAKRFHAGAGPVPKVSEQSPEQAQLEEKIDKHMVLSRLGPLRAVTLHAGKSPVTFLMHGNICLAALHAGDDELPSESRNQLATMVEKLSRTYSKPEPAHVDYKL